jgi:hypothetical protein
VFLSVGGKDVSYRDPSGMTVAEIGAVFFPEVAFEGFFSRSAIVRKCACADLASVIEDDPGVRSVSPLAEIEPWGTWASGIASSCWRLQQEL